MSALRSWNLKTFKDKKGVKEAMRVMGLSRSGLYFRLANNPESVRILEMDNGTYEAHQSTLINTVPIDA